MKNILVLGSGGREHAFVWKLKQSTLPQNIYVAPGNAGTASIAQNVSLDVIDFSAIGQFCLEKEVDFILVGPEVPLVQGIKDYFQSHPDLSSIFVFGPDAQGAQLEGSKDFAKNFLNKYNIPTARYQTFDQAHLEEGLKYLEQINAPYVLKADGLAAGKGVIITSDLAEAQAILKEMLVESKFGEASSKVLIEEFLQGIELSVFVMSDGDAYLMLPEAKDYKRIGEGDTGLNTGGMGSISPVPFANATFMQQVEENIVKPTIEGLKAEGIDYCGFIFIGLMNVEEKPYVIEYNVRMGDPENQSVLPRIQNDFGDLLEKAAQKTLSEVHLEVSSDYSTTVVMVSGGYPEKYEKGKKIEALDQVGSEVNIFHAGTKLDQGQIFSNGGRVLALNARAESLEKALQLCQNAADTVKFEKKFHRKDIGWDLLKILKDQ